MVVLEVIRWCSEIKRWCCTTLKWGMDNPDVTPTSEINSHLYYSFVTVSSNHSPCPPSLVLLMLEKLSAHVIFNQFWTNGLALFQTLCDLLRTESTFSIHTHCHCGLMMPYGEMDMGQYCLRLRHVAWRQQAITWVNVELSSAWSVRSGDIHLGAAMNYHFNIWRHQSVFKTRLKTVFLESKPNLCIMLQKWVAATMSDSEDGSGDESFAGSRVSTLMGSFFFFTFQHNVNLVPMKPIWAVWYKTKFGSQNFGYQN